MLWNELGSAATGMLVFRKQASVDKIQYVDKRQCGEDVGSISAGAVPLNLISSGGCGHK